MSGGRIVRYTTEDILALKDETDYARLRAEEEAGIEPELDEEEIGIEWDWSKAVLVRAPVKKAVSVRLDQDVIDWFKAEGPGYQTRMNAVLRSYMLARRGKGGT
ncbi:MAG: hypothetical protein RIR62_1314 [Pseudomonadota bacterium]|jgi:uncharacterized protein (DUF4415 family)